MIKLFLTDNMTQGKYSDSSKARAQLALHLAKEMPKSLLGKTLIPTLI